MADAICPCGSVLEPSSRRPRKYCSRKCSSAAAYRRNPIDETDRCTAEGCTRRRSTKGFCLAHYSAVARRSRTVSIVCAWCGTEAEVQRRTGRDNRYCSVKCGSQAYNDHKKRTSKPKPIRILELKQCEWCLQLHNGRNKFCSDDCRNERDSSKAAFKANISRRMRFRTSFETGDYAGFLEELKLRVDVDNDTGCWLWAMKLKNGYPVITWGNKQVQIHRVALEAKHGKPLGTQAAHHICAVSSCVNPDHLQPVTYRDNTAEMMQRRAYMDRIKELESALADVDPNNPVLNRIEVA